ncbi:FadR/GntR family transcriptional regulator [Jiangella anatolica]|uniref:GntR family transcriptional regulator n=1 Tax=Jiangella anatolica TaxID=2670374 RepID=A0A2W2C6G9_9ACTN|nr:FadR/GntR family transcriptional regulator [Jiangella anatolica]PZF81356.1 GntR family transcriptional regulator [Jiangella anatolica]
MTVFRGIHGAVVAHLGELIVRGDVEPGEPLDPVRLEADLGVSRTVVREALRVLAAKGLVDARPKRGTIVRPREEWALLDADVLRWRAQAPADAGFLADLAEVRGIVEPDAARLAAARRTDADLAAMRAALDVMAGEETSVDAVVEADLAFHRALLDAAHNALLRQLEQVIATGLRARDLLVYGHGGWAHSVPEHLAVLDAVAGGDADGAERAVRHLLTQADHDVRTITSGKEPE